MAKVFLLYFDLHTGYCPSVQHGLAYITGILKKHGHSVYLQHITEESMFKEVVSSIDRCGPDLIGLSFTTNQRKYVQKFMGSYKLNSGLIVAGGIHATLVKEQIFNEFPGIDGVCIGEGEIPISELCEKLDNKSDFYSVPSFYFKRKDRIIKNDILSLQDIENLVLPDYSLFDYRKIIEEGGYYFPMMLSRGCPYNCYYCCNHVLREVYPNKENYVRIPGVSKSIEIIKNNLKLYSGVKKIIFADDTFTLNKKWLSEFCVEFKNEINLPFLCNARVETIDSDVAKWLKLAGCVSVDFGVETGNEWLRKHILNRTHSNGKIEEAFGIIKDCGIKSFSFNIVGLPFETSEMAKDTLELNLKLKPNFGKCFYFYPYPGSYLHRLISEYGLFENGYEMLSGYLESPSLNETFMTHKVMRRYFELMQVYFYARLLFSKIKIYSFLEEFLLRIIFLFRRPILFFLSSNTSTGFFTKLRKVMRKVALQYFR